MSASPPNKGMNPTRYERASYCARRSAIETKEQESTITYKREDALQME